MRAKFASSLGIGVALALHSAWASAEVFEADSLIIPMDTTYQDEGMFLAYGLVYQLLLNDVGVSWVIESDKVGFGTDFTASAVDVNSGATISSHDYRGGPWVVAAEYVEVALPIVEGWIAAHPTTTVHQATAEFDAHVARKLVVAPTISMFADGNQKIARKYVQAAQIPDSVGSLLWADTSPDMLTPDEVAGATTTNHSDGALFDSEGDPTYCQLMSMHWGVKDARSVAKKGPEVVAEVRQFLTNPVHFFAECQAVNAFENDTVNGLFLTTQGFEIGDKPDAVDYFHVHSPFAQLDGPFEPTGGSEPAYSLPVGESYKASDIVMLSEQGTPVGVNDVWMTGFLDGACSGSEDAECGRVGKISYLGGHEYDTDVPLSTHPGSWGTKLFLNSLFEAPCATLQGQPELDFDKSGPAQTPSSQITYTLSVRNYGPTVASSVEIVDVLPAGASFVSASNGGVFSAGAVTWDLANLGVDEAATRDVTVTFAGYGSYSNTARLDYRVGSNDQSIDSNEVVTVYDGDSDNDGVVDAVDTCPSDPNPGQDFASDIDSCGACGVVCASASGDPSCSSGVCVTCGAGFADCDGVPGNGCEVSTSIFVDDEANCGGCGIVCDPANGGGECLASECQLSSCDVSFEDCNADPADGCEYATSGFATDPAHCGDCGIACAVGESCVAGGCLATCASGTADCDALVAGCEVDTDSDAANCGGCGLACSPTGGAGACVSGNCTVASCDPGFDDCDGLVANGCEYETASFESDTFNCGACGAACDLPSASADCVGGECIVGACDEGASDLDGDASNGCEGTDLGAGGAGSGGASNGGAGTGGADTGGPGGGGSESGTAGGSGVGEGVGGEAANANGGAADPGSEADAGLGDGSMGAGAQAGVGDAGGGGESSGPVDGQDPEGAVGEDDAGADDTSGDPMSPDDDPADDDAMDPSAEEEPAAGSGEQGADSGALASADGGLPMDTFGGAAGADGCGCRTAKPASSMPWAWLLTALALVFARRRSARDCG